MSNIIKEIFENFSYGFIYALLISALTMFVALLFTGLFSTICLIFNYEFFMGIMTVTYWVTYAASISSWMVLIGWWLKN